MNPVRSAGNLVRLADLICPHEQAHPVRRLDGVVVRTDGRTDATSNAGTGCAPISGPFAIVKAIAPATATRCSVRSGHSLLSHLPDFTRLHYPELRLLATLRPVPYTLVRQ